MKIIIILIILKGLLYAEDNSFILSIIQGETQYQKVKSTLTPIKDAKFTGASLFLYQPLSLDETVTYGVGIIHQRYNTTLKRDDFSLISISSLSLKVQYYGISIALSMTASRLNRAHPAWGIGHALDLDYRVYKNHHLGYYYNFSATDDDVTGWPEKYLDLTSVGWKYSYAF